MNVLTGEEFSRLIIYEGTEATIEKLRLELDKWLTSDIIRYLSWKRCPFPTYCVDDVKQATYKAVYLDIEKYRRREKTVEYRYPKRWLFRIERRFCIKDILKHVRERNNISLDDLDHPDMIDDRFAAVHPFNNLIESRHYRREQLICVRKYLLTLPPPQQTAFELFINDFSHKEIAFYLDITPGLSRQWISRSVRKIRQKISKF